MRKIITLIGPRMAHVGEKFVFNGPVKECYNCKLYQACTGNPNLEIGRVYEILNVRGLKHNCLISEDGVVAVEVTEAQITLMIQARYAIEGLVVTYQPISVESSSSELFKPEGLRPGDKIRILKVWKEKQTYGNETFVKVTVERVHAEQ